MTNKEILQKAIEKANTAYLEGSKITWGWSDDITDEDIQIRAFKIIFSHSFAKAFWGEERTRLVWYKDDNPFSFEEGFTWQVHLMKMVLEENRIKYLEQFL